jgi:hypothetical protein
VAGLESGGTLLELLRFSAESYIKLHSYLSQLEAELNGDEAERFPDATDLTGAPLPISATRKANAERLLQYSKIRGCPVGC